MVDSFGDRVAAAVRHRTALRGHRPVGALLGDWGLRDRRRRSGGSRRSATFAGRSR